MEKLKNHNFALALLLIASLLVLCGCEDIPEEEGARRSIHRMHEAVRVGPWEYEVIDSWWAESIDGVLGRENPKYAFLCVRLIARNVGRESETVPDFYLVDQSGAAYIESDASSSIKDSFSGLEELHPRTQKEGVVIFDVPHERHYVLKVFDSYPGLSFESALIELGI